MLIPVGLLACATVGVLISSYFTLVSFRLMSPDQPFIPAFCRMTEHSCSAIIDSPQARLLGVPNSLLGTIYYAGVMLSVISYGRSSTLLFGGLIAVSSLTVLMGAYLAYSLLSVLRIPCFLCLASHVLNLLILVLLLADFFS
jgi:uncharacterized membrane protein